VTIGLYRGRVRRFFSVHRLVLEAFVGIGKEFTGFSEGAGVQQDAVVCNVKHRICWPDIL
jgi:hypothetical protein